MKTKINIAVSILLSFAMTWITVPFRTIYYMEPDDYLLNYIANQSYGAADSDHLIYIRIVLGRLLAFLYNRTKSINFYLWMLLIILFLSFSVIHYLILKRTKWLFAIGLSCMIQAMIVPFFLTYTIVAFTAVTAGALLFQDVILSMDGAQKAHLGNGLLGIFFLYLGWQLRKDAVYPALAIAFPMLLISLIRLIRKQGWKSLFDSRRVILTLAGVLLVVLAGDLAIERAAYSSDVWKRHTAFNAARTTVVDFPILNYDDYEAEFEEAQIPKDVYTELVSWRFADQTRFSVDLMKRFAVYPKPAFQKREALNQLRMQFDPIQKLAAFLPCLTLLILLLRRKRGALTGGMVVLMFGALLAYLLMVRMRCVLRVSLPMAWTACLVVISLSDEDRCAHQKRAWGLDLICLLVMLLMSAHMTKQFRLSTDWMRRDPNAPLYQEIKAEIDSHPETLYIMDGSLISYLYYFDQPVTTLRTEERFLHLTRSGSWDSFSARYYHQAEQFGLKDPDRLLMAPYEEKHVEVITQNPKVYENYAGENGVRAEAVITEYPGRTAPVYLVRFKTA